MRNTFGSEIYAAVFNGSEFDSRVPAVVTAGCKYAVVFDDSR
jgi:hypothetical protein